MVAKAKLAIDPVIEICINTKSSPALKRGLTSGQYLSNFESCILNK
jgi:hypothetical protein